MPHGYLEWNLEELRAAMHLNAEDVLAYFTDGRRVSFMLERRIMREVLGGRLAASEGDDHDLVDSQGRKVGGPISVRRRNLLLPQLHGRIWTPL